MVSEEGRGDIYELTAEAPRSGSEGMRVSPSFPSRSRKKGRQQKPASRFNSETPSPCCSSGSLPSVVLRAGAWRVLSHSLILMLFVTMTARVQERR